MFGGLLASAIAKMDGVRDMSSWRWIFILEGITTILIGCISYFLIPDFPEDAKWLSPEEKDFVITRASTSKQRSQPITIGHILGFLSDIKNLAGGLMYFGGKLTAPCDYVEMMANLPVQLSLFLHTVRHPYQAQSLVASFNRSLF